MEQEVVSGGIGSEANARGKSHLGFFSPLSETSDDKGGLCLLGVKDHLDQRAVVEDCADGRHSSISLVLLPHGLRRECASSGETPLRRARKSAAPPSTPQAKQRKR